MLSVDDTVKCVLTCAPNGKNPRDLDISIKVDYETESEESSVHDTYYYQLK